MEKINEKNISALFVLLLLTAALSAASAKLPAIALPIPVILAYLMVRFKTAGGISGIAALGMAAVFSFNAALALAVAFIPMAITASAAIQKHTRFRNSVLATSAAALLGIILLIGVLWLQKRMLPVDYLVRRTGDMLVSLSDNAISITYQAARFLDVQTGAITQQAVLMTPRAVAIDTMLSMLHEWVNYFLVSGIAVYSLLSGLLCYLIPRSLAKRRGMAVAPVPPFSDFALPRGFWAAFVLSYLAAATGDALKLPSFSLLSDTVLYVYAFVFIVQAMSFVDFLFRSRGISVSMRVALQAFVMIIFGSLLMWLGIFENIFRFRSRQAEGGADI